MFSKYQQRLPRNRFYKKINLENVVIGCQIKLRFKILRQVLPSLLFFRKHNPRFTQDHIQIKLDFNKQQKISGSLPPSLDENLE